MAFDFTTPGEVCTLKALTFYEKPYLDINLKDMPSVIEVFDWIADNQIKVLNVAGSAGKTKEEGTYIFQTVRSYLNKVFKYALA